MYQAQKTNTRHGGMTTRSLSVFETMGQHIVQVHGRWPAAARRRRSMCWLRAMFVMVEGCALVIVSCDKPY
jgi:hypothetical protein